MHHADGLRLGRFVIPDDRWELALRPEFAGIFGDVGVQNLDYPDVTCHRSQTCSRGIRDYRSLEWLFTRAGYYWSGYELYAELDAIDLDSLSLQERDSHVTTVRHVTIELLDTYDLLVTLGGARPSWHLISRIHHADGLHLGGLVIPDERRVQLQHPDFMYTFGPSGAAGIDISDTQIEDSRRDLERAAKENSLSNSSSRTAP